MKFQTWPAKLAIAALLVTILPWQYVVYVVGKIIVFIVAAYYLAKGLGKNDDGVRWPLIITAILYNPFLPIYLFARGLWILADIVAIWIFWRTIKIVRLISASQPSGVISVTPISSALTGNGRGNAPGQCPNCGKQNGSGIGFCKNCGKRLG